MDQHCIVVIFTFDYDNNDEVVDRCNRLTRELYDREGHAIVLTVPPSVSCALVEDLKTVAIQLAAHGFMTDDPATVSNLHHIIGSDN